MLLNLEFGVTETEVGLVKLLLTEFVITLPTECLEDGDVSVVAGGVVVGVVVVVFSIDLMGVTDKNDLFSI